MAVVPSTNGAKVAVVRCAAGIEITTGVTTGAKVVNPRDLTGTGILRISVGANVARARVAFGTGPITITVPSVGAYSVNAIVRTGTGITRTNPGAYSVIAMVARGIGMFVAETAGLNEAAATVCRPLNVPVKVAVTETAVVWIT